MKKILSSLLFILLTYTIIYAQEKKREFTVTSIALDAQEEEMQTENKEDNNTKMQGGMTETY